MFSRYCFECSTLDCRVYLCYFGACTRWFSAGQVIENLYPWVWNARNSATFCSVLLNNSFIPSYETQFTCLIWIHVSPLPSTLLAPLSSYRLKLRRYTLLQRAIPVHSTLLYPECRNFLYISVVGLLAHCPLGMTTNILCPRLSAASPHLLIASLLVV